MDKQQRRRCIIQALQEAETPVSGEALSQLLQVTRQIIVKDVAALRADGTQILSTSRGYSLVKKKGIRKIIAVRHQPEQIKNELEIIIRNGGAVLNVMIEHPVYGEIRGDINISSISELFKFIALVEGSQAKPLLSVSEGGVHLHTIEVPSEEKYKQIKKELKEKGFWI
ncbi:MAG TPA: transcription repressor NadR [Thermotogota bacterium]|nr:transcription repressor NadR [Thermotogota bacterium]HRW34963.1 transcription repressor NadR [Thermotogota bacterium]